MRWCWVAVAMLGGAVAGCSGGADRGDAGLTDAPSSDAAVDDAPADAPRDAPADAAQPDDAAADAAPDAAPDAVPAIGIGTPQTFDETADGPVFGTPYVDSAWNGSRFVVVSRGAVSFFDANGTRTGVSFLPSVYAVAYASIACTPSGTCLVAWAGPDRIWLSRFSADGAPFDTTAVDVLGPGWWVNVGATADGFMVVIAGTTLPLGVIRVPAVGAPLDLEPLKPIEDLAWHDGYFQGIGCDDTSCSIVRSECLSTCPVRFVRVSFDGSIGPVLSVAERATPGAFACNVDRCLLIQQADVPDPIVGELLDHDGNSLGPSFEVGMIAGRMEFDLAAADDGFRLIGNEYATGGVSSVSVGVRTDGSIGPILTLSPASFALAQSIACGGPRCLVANASSDGDTTDLVLRRAVSEGDSVIDGDPLVVSANTQHTVQVGTDGTDFVAAWLDVRLDGDAVETSLRAAAWSITSGWSGDPSVDIDQWTAPEPQMYPVTPFAIAWAGDHYLVAWSHLARISADATSVEALPGAIGELRSLACQPESCLIASADGLRRIDNVSNAITGVSTASNLIVVAFAGEFLAIGPGSSWLTRIGVDGTMIDSFDIGGGWPISTFPLTPARPALATTRIGDHLVVVWNSGTHVLGRTVSSTFALGPIIELPVPRLTRDTSTITAIGDTVLVSWLDYDDLKIHGQRFASNLMELDPTPFDIAQLLGTYPGTFSMASIGTDVLAGWHAPDPVVGVERLHILHLTPPP